MTKVSICVDVYFFIVEKLTLHNFFFEKNLYELFCFLFRCIYIRLEKINFFLIFNLRQRQKKKYYEKKLT